MVNDSLPGISIWWALETVVNKLQDSVVRNDRKCKCIESFTQMNSSRRGLNRNMWVLLWKSKNCWVYGVLGYYYQLLITGRALGSCHQCHVSDEAEFCIGTVNVIKSLVIRSSQGSSTLLMSLILKGNAVKCSFDDRFCWNQTCGCMHWIFCTNVYFTSINVLRPDRVEFIDELGQPIIKEVTFVTSSPIGWDFCSTLGK